MKIKEPEKLLEIAREVKPLAFKLLLFIILKYKPHEPFRLTYFDMGQMAHIKSPHPTMSLLIEHGFIAKKIVGKNECEYTLLIDLIDFE